jgi:hypothetical protein
LGDAVAEAAAIFEPALITDRSIPISHRIARASDVAELSQAAPC